MLLPLLLRPYDIALSLLKQEYFVSPPQLVTLRYSVLEPETAHEPAAELLADLMLPEIVTDVVLQQAHTTSQMLLRTDTVPNRAALSCSRVDPYVR